MEKETMETAKELFRLENVCIGTKDVTIDRDLSLCMAEGEIVGIIGESGSGKSTLLRSVLHLEEEQMKVKHGLVFWQGRNLHDLPEDARRHLCGKEIALIFQSLSMAFDPITRIRKQYLEAMRCHDRAVTKEQMTQKAVRLLEEVRFPEPEKILNAYPFELSGGMLQRAAIVMAMLNDPKLIMADEMTSALDLVSQEQVLECLLRIRRTHGTAILFVTHNMAVIRKIADKVAVMYGGRIMEYGTREEILQAPAHPYTRALIEAVPKKERTLPKGIPGRPPSFEETRECCPFAQRCGRAEEKCRSGIPERRELSETHYVYCW